MKSPAIFLLSLLCIFPAVADDLAGSQPNVILVITDDQGYAPVGRHGHPWLKTPNMDKLYDTSTRFDRFLVSPTCSPTRAALMTGRHPMKNGVTHTILERERMALDPTTLPQALQKAGYTTGIFGKWHLGDEEEYQPGSRGFDEVFLHGAGGIGQAYDCSCADAPENSYYGPWVRHNGKFVKTDDFCTNVFFRGGLGWINEVKEGDKPFFAYITTNAPHGPFLAPEENEKRFTDLGFDEKTAGFYGMIENIDENLGLMLEKLEEWDLMKDTVVIFMSDNGMTGGGSGPEGKPMGTDENGSPMIRYNAGMKGLKGSADEGGVRVPFFMRWDGKIPTDNQIETIAAHIDIFPTIAALAGADVPADQVEGRSLLPLIENPDAEWADRYFFTQKARWPTGSEPNDHQWSNWGVRGPRYRLVGAGTAKGQGEKKNKKAVAKTDELYDMLEDPGQKNDIAAEHPEIVAEMRAAYDAFWKEARPLMVNEEAPMSPTRPYHVWFEAQEKAEGIPAWEAPEL